MDAKKAINVAIVGVGGIGGLLAARLVLLAEEISALNNKAYTLSVSLYVRPGKVQHYKENGLRLLAPASVFQNLLVDTTTCPAAALWSSRKLNASQGTDPFVEYSIPYDLFKVYEQFSEMPVQDYVFLATKTHDLPSLFSEPENSLARILRKDATAPTKVVTLQNGIPFWFFRGHGVPEQPPWTAVPSVDPSGILSDNLPAACLFGAIAYPAAELVSTGVIKLHAGTGFPIGVVDLDPSRQCDLQQVNEVARIISDSGLKSRAVDDIRGEIWVKNFGTSVLNPISMLTHATLREISHDLATLSLMRKCMEELVELGEAMGIRLRVSIDQRIEGIKRLNTTHKTSSLMDLENGKPSEALHFMETIEDIKKALGVPTPNLDAVYTLTKLLLKKVQSGHRIQATQMNLDK